MFETKIINISIQSKLAVDVLLRAIDGEIRSMVETMNQCNTEDFTQYQIYNRADDQREELQRIKDQIRFQCKDLLQ